MHLKLSLPGQARHWRWVLLGLLLLATLLFPATREAHVLTVRLLFHLNGKTIVQGQPSGCTIYVVPNVKFSDGYIAELRARSGRSLDDYALALGDLRHAGLEVPPIDAAWTNHPLMNWAAFQLTRNVILSARSVSDTNGVVTNLAAIQLEVDLARKAVHVARSASPTNGAWWLLEAGLNFIEDQPEKALANLREAAVRPVWDASLAPTKRYLVEIFRRGGLSELDAIIEGGNLTPDHAWIFTRQELSRSLGRQFVAAIEQTNESRLVEVFSTLVELRKGCWSEVGRTLLNGLRFYDPYDSMVNAMAQRLGLPAVPEFTFESREMRRRILQETEAKFLSLYISPKILAWYEAQNAGLVTEKRLRDVLREQAWNSGKWVWFYCMVIGGVVLFTLAGLCVLSLTSLPFRWLLSRQSDLCRMPRSRGFWAMSLAAMVPSVLLLVSVLFAIGEFSRIGFGPPEPPPMLPPWLEATLIAGAMWVSCFTVGMAVWVDKKSPKHMGGIIKSGVLIYLTLIVLMALSRTAMAGHIMSPWW